MARRLASITLDNMSDLPVRCRSCVYWELDPVAGERACDSGSSTLEKEAWLSDTLLEWGSCGQLAYVDGVPAGYVLFAPAAYVPRSVAFPTSPVSADAVLLMTARIAPEFRGGGLGRVLVQTVARDIVRRGVRAIEAFGRVDTPRDAPRDWPRYARRNAPLTDPTADPTGEPAANPGERAVDDPHACLLPADYLRAVGFKTVRAHPRTPRLRLDVRTTASWKEDVEYALERLLGTMQSPVLSR